MNYLKKLPVDVLDIDKSFVDGLGADNDASAIVRATINMANDRFFRPRPPPRSCSARATTCR